MSSANHPLGMRRRSRQLDEITAHRALSPLRGCCAVQLISGFSRNTSCDHWREPDSLVGYVSLMRA